MAFHQFEHGGSFEVFHIGEEEHPLYEEGWYWWPCLPGCMPDCDEAFGPFPTECSATHDALSD